ncbi:MAG: sortase [Microbacterium sp.]
MNDRAAAIRHRIAAALVVIGLAGLIGAFLLWNATRAPLGDVPMAPAPTSTSSLPAAPPSSTTGPTSAPSPAPLQDIAGVPVHVTVLQQGAPLIDADVKPIQLDDNGWLSPEAGLAGWYGPPQWDTVPGNLSEYRGIIVGHNVTGTGTKDVFYDLGRARTGDRVVITYALRSGGLTTADFIVAQDARAVPKQDVVTLAQSEYKWVWQSDTPQRALSLFSCDLDAPHVDGHSLDNWIVVAERVS